jgi:hypothetical protein
MKSRRLLNPTIQLHSTSDNPAVMKYEETDARHTPEKECFEHLHLNICQRRNNRSPPKWHFLISRTTTEHRSGVIPILVNASFGVV